MPSIFRKNTTGWVEILSVFRKNTTGWVEILNAYRKNTTAWVKVFARSQIPGITSFPKVRNSSGDDINNTTVIARVGDTLTGYRGSWSNSPTVYEDRWYFNQYASDGNYGPFSPAQTNTTLSTNLSHNGYYVVYQVRATNASGSSDYVTSSNAARVVKYSPVSLSISPIGGSTIVGGTLIAGSQNSLWRNTTSISGDTYPDSFEYEWSYSDGTILQFNSSNSYLIDPDDLGKTIRLRVTGTNTGGSATSGYTTSGVVTTPYSFNFGNILYVGSNGYIGLDSGGSIAGTAGSGRNINIWNEDLVNYRIQEYSDSSNYHLYVRAYMYQDPLVRSSITALDYQIKFYTGQPYCDVYLVRKGSSVPAYINDPGYYSNGLFGTSGFSGTFVAGSVLRVYFDGSTPASTSGISWTAIPDSVWKSISTSDIDDSYVAVTTSANQQNVFASPTPTSVTYSSGVFTINFTGGSGEFFQGWYQTDSLAIGTQPALVGTTASTPDTPQSGGSFTSSPLTRTLTASPGYTYYWWVRSSLTATGTGAGNVTDWAGPVSIKIPDATMTTAPTYGSATSTSNGFTASINNTPNPSGGTYAVVSNSNANASTTITAAGAVTVTGLSASASNTVTVSYSKFGYTTVQFTVTGTASALAQYTITWAANGGSVSPSSTTVTAGSSVTAPTPTRSGFTFSRWRNPPSGDLLYSYNAGDTFTPTESFTLTAIWTAIVVTANISQIVMTPSGSSSGVKMTATWTGTGISSVSYDVYRSSGTASGAAIDTYVTSGTTTGSTITTSSPTTGLNYGYQFYLTPKNSAGTSGTTRVTGVKRNTVSGGASTYNFS
jgi:uncharacterized repeat protein (TIGR02543 family)